MTIILALIAPLVLGTADHIATRVGRRGRVLAVVFWLFIVSVPTTGIAALIIGGSPTRAELLLGLSAGVFGAAGLSSIYLGYTKWGVGVVGPVAAVTGAIVPIGVSAITEGLPSSRVAIGIAVGIGAIWLIGFRSSPPDDESPATPPERQFTQEALLFGERLEECSSAS